MRDFIKPVQDMDICKSHSARTDRDARICPSKLSRRELEDLYYNLHNDNINLKQTNNIQQENIKILSTKLQRLTAGQKTLLRETSDCCSGAKSLIKDQRESIAELKRLNSNLIEKNRLLNMKMCSFKQFMKRSPPRNRSLNTNLSYMRNSSVSMLSLKRSDMNLQTTEPIHLENRSIMTERALTNDENVDNPEKDNMQVSPKKLCTENKCKTLVDELKMKIHDLEQVLSSVQEDYSVSVSRLKLEVQELQEEKIRITGDKTVEDINLQRLNDEVQELRARLREADAKNGDLTMQLSIEKSKLAELEARLKSMELSNSLGDFIDEHLCKMNNTRADASNESYHLNHAEWKESSPGPQVPTMAKKSKATETLVISGVAKSDDSGYTEANKSSLDEDKASIINRELLHRIADLQAQVDALKVQAVANSSKSIVEYKPVQIPEDEYLTFFTENDAEDESHSKKSNSLISIRSRDSNSLLGDKDSIRSNVPSIEKVEKELNKQFTSNDPIPKITKNIKTDEPISSVNCVSARMDKSQKVKKSNSENRTAVKNKINKLDKKHSKLHPDESFTKPIDDENKANEISYKKCNINTQNHDCKCPPFEGIKEHFPRSSKSYEVTKSKLKSEAKLTRLKGSDKHTKRHGITSLDSRGTYTLDGGRESPQSTDYEISTMSDLPPEKETSRHLSPGEDLDDVFSESYTMTTEYGSLSIGEVPGKRGRNLSVGEQIVKSRSNTNEPPMPEQLESALKSICAEMNRCGRMLMTRPPPATEVT